MLDHLDDPRPFRPDDDFRSRVRSRGRRLRARRMLAGGMTAVLFLGGVAGAGALYVERRDAAIDRIEVVTTPSLDGATNVLLLGTDGAQPLDGGEPASRADTMAILRIGADGSVRVLSLPRDLWVPRREARLNQSFADGGAQQLVTDITELTGIPIDHYVELTFEGFAGLVDEVGGIPLRVDYRMRDAESGLHLDASPCATVDGPTALALLRSRQLMVEGMPVTIGWAYDTSGDIGRMHRARAVMAAALEALGASDPGADDPAALDRLSRVLADHAVLDSGLTLGRMIDLGGDVLDASPAALTGETLPVIDRNMDGAQVLVATTGAPAVYARFGAPPVDAPPPGAPPDDPPFEGLVPIGPCDPG